MADDHLEVEVDFHSNLLDLVAKLHAFDEELDKMIPEAHRARDALISMENAIPSISMTKDELANMRRELDEVGLAAIEAGNQAQVGMDEYGNKIEEIAALTEEAAHFIANMDRAIVDSGGDAVLAAAEIAAYNHELERMAMSAEAAAAGNERAAAKMRVGLGWWRLTLTQWHWILTAGFEVLATAIPAIIALGAAVAGMAQTFIKIGAHLGSLTIAIGGFGKMLNYVKAQAGETTGGFQKLANAMKPDAYRIFGSVIQDMGKQTGNFAKMAQGAGDVLANFANKIYVEFFSAGSAVHTYTGKAVKDMQMWGQVIGKVADIVIRLISVMPGMAELLLHVADVALRFVDAMTQGIPGGILTAVFAFHELTMWGGLVAKMFIRITGAFSGWAARLGEVVAGMGKLGGAGEGAAAGLGKLSSAFAFLADIPVYGYIAAIGAVIGIYLLSKIMSAKDATDKLIESVQKLNNAVSNTQVYGTLASGMQKLSNQAKSVTDNFSKFYVGMATHTGELPRAYQDTQKLTSAMEAQRRAMVNVNQGAAYLMKTYGISYPAALLVADQAGVKLNKTILGTSQAAILAREKIASLILGFKEMNAPAGKLGQDLKAVEVAASQASSTISKLNQAWDQFVTNATNALTAFGQYLQGLGSVRKDAQAAGASLHGLSASSVALRNDFQGSFQSMEQMADSLRLAGVQGSTFRRAIVDMIQPLYKLSASDKGARAELQAFAREAGITSPAALKKLVEGAGNATKSGKDLRDIMNKVTGSMADLDKMAKQLNDGLNQDIANAMNTARFATSGAKQAIDNYTADVQKFGPTSAQAKAALEQMVKTFEKAGETAKQARADALAYQNAIDGLHGKTITITTFYQQTGALPGGPRLTGTHPVSGAAMSANAMGGSGGGGNMSSHFVTNTVAMGGGTNVHVTHVHVAGSVVTEQQLGRTIQTQQLRHALRNQGTGISLNRGRNRNV